MATFRFRIVLCHLVLFRSTQKTYLYYGKNQAHQGFVQSLIVLMVGELNT